MAEKLTAVQQQVSLLERDRVEQYGQLAQQLQDARLVRRAALAVNACLGLSAPFQQRTRPVGRSSAPRVVEASGMLRHVDFHEQVHSRT